MVLLLFVVPTHPCGKEAKITANCIVFIAEVGWSIFVRVFADDAAVGGRRAVADGRVAAENGKGAAWTRQGEAEFFSEAFTDKLFKSTASSDGRGLFSLARSLGGFERVTRGGVVGKALVVDAFAGHLANGKLSRMAATHTHQKGPFLPPRQSLFCRLREYKR